MTPADAVAEFTSRHGLPASGANADALRHAVEAVLSQALALARPGAAETDAGGSGSTDAGADGGSGDGSGSSNSGIRAGPLPTATGAMAGPDDATAEIYLESGEILL